MAKFNKQTTGKGQMRLGTALRSSRGQSVVVLMILLTAFILGPICFLAFELTRYNLAKQQLKACVESAALAAGATQASSNSTNTTATQQSAEATALNMFQQNSILDQSLATASQSGSATMNPAANTAMMYFQFLDPTTMQVVPLGSTNGKIIQVEAAFGYCPIFSKFIGLGTDFPIYETSNGGLPMLDVVLCFDISASMDDFTPITAVNRYNIPATSKAVASNGYSIVTQGPLYTAFQCSNSTGTGLNATFPQSLDASSGSSGYYPFSASGRGVNNGAAPTAALSNSNPPIFTDLVVNIDGTNTFSQGATVTYNSSSYSFPAGNIGCLVEAARGNLESTTIATTARVPYTTWGITPKAGYFNAYVQAAFAQRQPIQTAITAAQNFFTILNNDCNVHFGLVTFSTNPGSSSSSTVPGDYGTNSLGNITDNPSTYESNAYPSDPCNPMPPNPEVILNPTAGPTYSNYATVNSAVTPLLAYGGTNISGALQTALSQLTTDARTNSTRAIVLFTDGLPTESSLGGDPTTDARTEASVASTDGIPIYCIGLCLVPALQSTQTDVLTDQNSSPSSGGIAGISGHGAAFYQATQLSDLNLVFENVARSLVQLVR